MALPTEAPSFADWLNFYEIVGCSGGGLVGLQFVVIALIANVRSRPDSQAIHAFGTPNVVHFAATLMISAIMSMPWPSLFSTSVVIGICGIVGLGYSIAVFHRAGRQRAYRPDLEDWLFYTIVPCVIYAELACAAVVLQFAGRIGLFMIAGAALGLLLIGLRNSWDSVTHVVTGGIDKEPRKPE